MGPVVRGFLGRDLEIPDDRWYFVPDHLWVRDEGGGVYAVGLTEAGWLLCGGVRQADLLVAPGEPVEAGQTVCLLLTAKLKYLAAPLAGRVFAGDTVAGEIDPYGLPLFRVRTGSPDRSRLVDAVQYVRSLRDSEGIRNPGGATGPGSSICKALYWGLRQQRLDAEAGTSPQRHRTSTKRTLSK